ncbi:AN1-type zinc finger protein 4 [Callorhinchus milii]|uniref:Zinc finger, AN1-type domain 4 n=1 Tax=Callorhinchus milii TaxID=7868 RepID=A0A4W3I2B2_CALMI|nr:AN1-type zinc finger protein 4 [Callorhinchus milii]XP_042193014.1 AN1-type zinc finger protein 4 [Callorhinchus milii]|eukprot:gi/632937169/ref/XP_007897519.1/ PREDICTED: AN1-type zinc finger protein 4 [Callorhinchus milii]
MENKKEPPFFNEDNSGPISYKLPFYETMELFIETLTGTCFELRVSPFETVISVKAKIQRLEGIPIAQQHLIWNNLELEDEYCLHDYNISEGCTLKLVLAMRGGPINTRRVPMDDQTRDMAEYMEAAQDDFWDKIPSNKQVTFLVYREGDQLNFFRVVDRGDGTLTPLSESLSGGSVFNLYTEDEEDAEESPSGQQILENSITMNKMKLLKAKMENMNLTKKPKKITKMKPRPPIAPRPSSGSITTARHRLLRVLPHNGQSLNRALCLPPVGDQRLVLPTHNLLASNFAPGVSLASSSSGFSLKEDENADLAPLLHNNLPSPGIVLTGELRQQKMLPPLISQETKGAEITSADLLADYTESGSLLKSPAPAASLLEELRVSDTAAALFSLSENGDKTEKPNETSLESPLSEQAKTETKATERELAEPALRPVFPNALACVPIQPGKSNIAQLTPKENVVSPTWYPAQNSPNSLISLAPSQRPSKTFDMNSLRPHASQHLLHTALDINGFPDNTMSKTSRFRGVKVESPGKKPDIISKMEAREVTEMANKSTKEPLGSSKDIGMFASLARSTSRDGMQNGCGGGRRRTGGVALAAGVQNFHDEIFRTIPSPDRVPNTFVSSHALCTTGRSTTMGRRIGTPSHHFPPVKASTQTKKKNAKHCFLCGKKTGLATSYECRCGNNFCATHRYAETHECTYDYKSAGRRYLQETNPVVSAPKLPKI